MATRTANATQKRIPSSNPGTAPVPVQEQYEPEQIMKAAIGFADITVEIPEAASLADVEKTLLLAIAGYNRLRDASERLKPVIGRILLTVQDRKLFRPTYKNFTEFVMAKVVNEMGFGRSNAFDSLKIAKAFPHFTSDDYQKYGATRLLLASRVTDETDPQHKELLDKATQVTTEAFEVQVKAIHGEQAKGVRTPTTTLTMRVGPDVKEEWNAMLEASGMQPNDLLVACMAAMRRMPELETQNTGAGRTPVPAAKPTTPGGMPINTRRR